MLADLAPVSEAVPPALSAAVRRQRRRVRAVMTGGGGVEGRYFAKKANKAACWVECLCGARPRRSTGASEPEIRARSRHGVAGQNLSRTGTAKKYAETRNCAISGRMLTWIRWTHCDRVRRRGRRNPCPAALSAAGRTRQPNSASPKRNRTRAVTDAGKRGTRSWLAGFSFQPLRLRPRPAPTSPRPRARMPGGGGELD